MKFENIWSILNDVEARGEPQLGLGIHRLWNYVELFWNSLDNAPSSIVFYLEMKVKVEVGVHDIRTRFTPREEVSITIMFGLGHYRFLRSEKRK